ncbi:MAG: N-acetyltransferase [Ignavibacteriae bacterium]|nr:MAG: N-acetyltransferase [Ignavibacteriota bacterium]
MHNTELKPDELFKNLPILETERIRLRPLSIRDASQVFEYACEPEVARFVTWEHHRSLSDSMHFLRLITQQYKNNIPSPWGIVYKEENKLIGTGGYHLWQKEHARAEFGYAISANYWNKGLMTEVLKEMIRFGFNVMELNRIEAKCYPENIASEKVMLKCGLKFEGISRECVFIKGKFRDLKQFSILKSEY